MHTDIIFPHLGIYLNHVGKCIQIGDFCIAYYGIIIGLGILAGLFLAITIAKKTGQDTGTYYDVAVFSVIFGVIGARLYYVIFSWDYYKDHLLQIFNIRGGGLAIYGGILAAILTIIIYSRIKKKSFLLILDTIAPGVVLAQAMGRWGNFFNREAFGEYTDSLFAMQLPVDAVFSSSITEKMMLHIQDVGGVPHIQVHPTFFYESCWCLATCILLLLYTKHKKFNGEILLLYLLFYACGRIWIEGLRTDQLIIGNTGIPVSQLLAGVLILFSLVTIIVKRVKMKHA